MRILNLILFTLAVSTLTACNAPVDDSTDIDTDNVANHAVPAAYAPVASATQAIMPTHLMLEARIIYAQPGLDGSKTLTYPANTVSVKVPATLDVVSGNSSNSFGYVQLMFPDGGYCQYNGGSNVQYPLADYMNPISIEKGKRYVFNTCFPSGKMPGDSITLGSVKLKVYQGDPTYPETVVRAFLEVE